MALLLRTVIEVERLCVPSSGRWYLVSGGPEHKSDGGVRDCTRRTQTFNACTAHARKVSHGTPSSQNSSPFDNSILLHRVCNEAVSNPVLVTQRVSEGRCFMGD
jgi:hypothetical protein